MRRQRKHLTQAELKALGVQPGLHAVRYPAGSDRAEVRELVGESKPRSPFFVPIKQMFDNE